MNLFQLLFISGVILLFLNNKLTCPPKKVEYRYLPRTLNENMLDSAFSSQNVMKTYTNDNHSWIVFNDDSTVNKQYNLENGL